MSRTAPSSSGSAPRASRTRPSPRRCRRSTSPSRCSRTSAPTPMCSSLADARPMTPEALETADDARVLIAGAGALFTARVHASTAIRAGRRALARRRHPRSPLLRSRDGPAPRAGRDPRAGARPVTKQHEAREQVLELIETLQVGDAIPSERALSHDLGVSRLTLRAALDELVREGRLTRRRGSGTFVAEPKVAKGMTITSFSDDMRLRGLTPGSRTLEFRTVPAGARLGRILHVSPSEPVLSVKRLRLADGEPMAVELLHVPGSLFPGLTAHDLEEGSFYDLMVTRYGIEIVGGTQTVEPTVTGEEESHILGVPHPLTCASLRARHAFGHRRDRRVHELDLPRRPLPARLRARHRRPAGRSDRARSTGARQLRLTAVVSTRCGLADGLLRENARRTAK